MALYVAYANSALNPVLYGGFNDNFRRGFKDAFLCLVPAAGKNKVHPGKASLCTASIAEWLTRLPRVLETCGLIIISEFRIGSLVAALLDARCYGVSVGKVCPVLWGQC